MEPQTVTNPRLIFIVGCFGLLSNILGLFLFHEHGHSHGGQVGTHNHDDTGEINAAEEGHSQATLRGDDLHTYQVADESGNVADVLPQSTIANWPKSSTPAVNYTPKEGTQQEEGSRSYSKTDEDDSTFTMNASPLSTRKSYTNGTPRGHRRHASGSRSRYASVDDIHIHPASFRNEIIAASRMDDIESSSDNGSDNENVNQEESNVTERAPLLSKTKSHTSNKHTTSSARAHNSTKRHDSWHVDHNHSQPKQPDSSGGHSHGDLNMRGVFLHVMGDALGNIGVIASALFIWLTNYSWRFYSDPVISLIITLIILGSAIPLCRAASRILLQAVPAGISIDKIKEDIDRLPGILSCHHVHVWQLSDTKLVASLHVQVEYDIKGEGSARYMSLARAIRHCLHEYGIHSSTIQPEFCLDNEHRHTASSNAASDGERSRNINGTTAKSTSKPGSKAASMRSEPDVCLLDCGDECAEGAQCCEPSGSTGTGDGAGHDHTLS